MTFQSFFPQIIANDCSEIHYAFVQKFFPYGRCKQYMLQYSYIFSTLLFILVLKSIAYDTEEVKAGWLIRLMCINVYVRAMYIIYV